MIQQLLAPGNIQGTHISSSVQLPVGVTRIVAEALIGTTGDYEDTTNSFRLSIYQSKDSGATWQHRFGLTWKGGHRETPSGEVNPNPWLSWDFAPEDAETLWRAELDVPKRMKLGFQVDLT